MLLDKNTGERLLEHEKQQDEKTGVEKRQEGDAEATDQVAGDEDAEAP